MGLVVALTLNNQVYEGALEAIGLPLCLVDRDGLFAWLNAGARALVGDVVGQRFSRIVVPDRVGEARRRFAGDPVDQTATASRDAVVVDRDGRRLPVRTHSVDLGAGGGPTEVLVAVIPRSSPAEAPTAMTGGSRAAARLTGRQQETLMLLGDGFGTTEIAATLSISVQTTRNHIRAVLAILGAHSRIEAVAVAHRIGLLPGQT